MLRRDPPADTKFTLCLTGDVQTIPPYPWGPGKIPKAYFDTLGYSSYKVKRYTFTSLDLAYLYPYYDKYCYVYGLTRGEWGEDESRHWKDATVPESQARNWEIWYRVIVWRVIKPAALLLKDRLRKLDGWKAGEVEMDHPQAEHVMLEAIGLNVILVNLKSSYSERLAQLFTIYTVHNPSFDISSYTLEPPSFPFPHHPSASRWEPDPRPDVRVIPPPPPIPPPSEGELAVRKAKDSTKAFIDNLMNVDALQRSSDHGAHQHMVVDTSGTKKTAPLAERHTGGEHAN